MGDVKLMGQHPEPPPQQMPGNATSQQQKSPRSALSRLPEHIISDGIAKELVADKFGFMKDETTRARNLAAFAGQSKLAHTQTLRAVALPHLNRLRRSITQLQAVPSQQPIERPDTPPAPLDLTAALHALNRLTALFEITPAEVGPLNEPSASVSHATATSMAVFEDAFSRVMAQSNPTARSMPPEVWGARAELERALLQPLKTWSNQEAHHGNAENAWLALSRIAEAARSGGPDHLDLGHLNLQTMPPIWHYAPNIGALNLAGNQIDALPIEIGTFKNLYELILQDNRLVALPADLGQLRNLRELSVQGNALSQFPEQICSLAQLEGLNLSRNSGIATLPAAMSQLKKLTFLDINSCPLTTFPTALLQMEGLRELDMGFCGLTTVPDDIKKMKHLVSLALGGNGLTTLPQTMAELMRLKGLELNDNAFVEFPEVISALQNLMDLRLDHNPMRRIVVNINPFNTLQTLSLSNCGLINEPYQLEQLTNLRFLALSHNPLGSIDTSLQNLQKLVELDVSATFIDALPKQFEKLFALETLNLAGNRLTVLPDVVLRLRKLSELVLAGNPLDAVPENLLQKKELASLYVDAPLLEKMPPRLIEKFRDKLWTLD